MLKNSMIDMNKRKIWFTNTTNKKSGLYTKISIDIRLIKFKDLLVSKGYSYMPNTKYYVFNIKGKTINDCMDMLIFKKE